VKTGNVEIVMLSVFGDESHDSTKARVFVVAGLLGDDLAWAEVRKKWNDRVNGLVFHAADCESGYGDFHSMPESERLQMHRDLTQIIADSRLMGYGSAIDLAGCRGSVPSVMNDFPSMPYYDCFVKTIGYLADLANVFIPPDKVEFTFDQHRETQYNAGLLYDWITNYKNTIVEKVSFGTRKEPGIQAADLWARELMKRCDTHVFNQRANPRPQWVALANTKRFRFKFLLGSELVRDMEHAGEVFELDHADYEEWRNKHKLIDNLSNRFRWFAMKDKARQ
jgi:hypothetical protein